MSGKNFPLIPVANLYTIRSKYDHMNSFVRSVGSICLLVQHIFNFKNAPCNLNKIWRINWYGHRVPLPLCTDLQQEREIQLNLDISTTV